jgi:hypothetical protein
MATKTHAPMALCPQDARSASRRNYWQTSFLSPRSRRWAKRLVSKQTRREGSR